MMWVHGWSEKEVVDSIAEYTRVARNYYQDALPDTEQRQLVRRGLDLHKPLPLPTRASSRGPHVDRSPLRFMLMHHVEKIQLSSEWGKTNRFQDMTKTQILFHWAFLLPADHEDVITCSQLAFRVPCVW
jgi:hypothetical protein